MAARPPAFDSDPPPRALLADLYAAAVAAVAPGPALTAALAELETEPARRVWILGLGKAAHPMATAAVAALRARSAEPAGGVIVAPAEAPPPQPALIVRAGDHPEPGPRSLAAAAALGAVAARVRPEDEVWVLLSGGATSLVAAPIDGVAPAELADLYALLLGSGLDIAAMNAIRKRFSRWGAGRLATALAPARVRVFVVSDVIGDDLAAIGSGPCAPDRTTAAEVRARLTSAGLWERLPQSIARALAAVDRGLAPETPKPGDPVFATVDTRIVANNRSALSAAAARASALGIVPALMDAALAGEATRAGRRIASELGSYRPPDDLQPAEADRPICLIWGGETTVTLGSAHAGRGGRCQELALAAAGTLGERRLPGGRMALLAAGTDGRDGPTDAAGAIVDDHTWERIRRTGRDPERDLAAHDAYPALDAAGALLRTGLTGTNVMDIVIGLRA